VQVQGLSGATGVAAGIAHTVVSKNDGTVWTWGSNAFGQLGDGTTPRSDSRSISPVQVLDLQL
jgi:alpha-tubulin suppressor-like RCC1 family protein